MADHFSYKKGLIAPFLVLCFILASCAGSPPLKEQAKAHIAKKYAKENGALKNSPKNYRKALSLLKYADDLFEDRVYKKSKKIYVYSRKYFEKAELRSRLINIKKGADF